MKLSPSTDGKSPVRAFTLIELLVVIAIKGLCLEGEERTARLKRFRLLLI